MNTFNPADSTGGHSLKPKKAECTACHLGDRITPVQENIEIKRIELAELLVARKVFKQTTNSSGAISYSALQTHDFFGVLFPTVQETTKFAIALAAANGNMANWEPLTIMAKSTANYQKGYTILFTPCRCCRILSIG